MCEITKNKNLFLIDSWMKEKYFKTSDEYL